MYLMVHLWNSHSIPFSSHEKNKNSYIYKSTLAASILLNSYSLKSPITSQLNPFQPHWILIELHKKIQKVPLNSHEIPLNRHEITMKSATCRQTRSRHCARVCSSVMRCWPDHLRLKRRHGSFQPPGPPRFRGTMDLGKLYPPVNDHRPW